MQRDLPRPTDMNDAELQRADELIKSEMSVMMQGPNLIENIGRKTHFILHFDSVTCLKYPFLPAAFNLQV